ncbi:CopG family transcriptional regulator [Variovorax soli]|nr:CopG family transcriptional regulator [Variovorax soli]
MELKPARLTLLAAPHGREAFERPCAPQDGTASQRVRRLPGEPAQHGT